MSEILSQSEWEINLTEAGVSSDPERKMAGRNALRADRAALRAEIEQLRNAIDDLLTPPVEGSESMDEAIGKARMRAAVLLDATDPDALAGEGS